MTNWWKDSSTPSVPTNQTVTLLMGQDLTLINTELVMFLFGVLSSSGCEAGCQKQKDILWFCFEITRQLRGQNGKPSAPPLKLQPHTATCTLLWHRSPDALVP